MTAIRIVIGIVITAIVAVTLVPMFALLDLAGGGDGLGLCGSGLASCRTSYFDGFELLATLVVVLFLLLMTLRAAFHVRSLIEQRRDAEAIARSVRGRGRLSGR
ncbi:MAG: hypothetical protein A2Z12_08540 [Actinobacteria bacterium RBG_16_68_21]|nr:MAG: hypothetical protein A2Z12_08540 [Actinobacteria bacterium RBG_16_68_21]